jgi:hypothetical protein
LTIKEVPEGNQLNGIIDYTIKRGNDVAFNVELISGAEPLTVKWIFRLSDEKANSNYQVILSGFYETGAKQINKYKIKKIYHLPFQL